MSYIRKYESFRKYRNDDSVNEEIFGTLFNWVKGFFQRQKQAINKTKGGKEVDAIYDKYLKLINTELERKAQVEIQLKGEEELMKQNNQPKKEPLKTVESVLIKEEAEDEAPVINQEEEGEGKDKQLDAKTLKAKLPLITQIIDKLKKAAKVEMEKVITKFGGADQNPDLKVIIDNKIREFDLALLNAEIEFLEKAGDKSAIQKVKINRDKVQKEIENNYKKIGTEAAKEIKVGDKSLKLGKKYRYKTEGGVKTIVVKAESDEEGKVQASWTYGDKKDEVQNFTVDNIDTEFVPVKDKKYGYFSQNNNAVIDVTVIGDADDTGMIEVKTGKNQFKVEAGALLDKEEEGEGEAKQA